jgi:IS605 OrfB family transposase
LQTISVPFSCSTQDHSFIREVRRVYSAAVRTAYANAEGLKQKDLRDFVKNRFAGGIVDAWTLHCATLEVMDLRKTRPDGKMLFGTRAGFERRQRGLISRDQWREMRIRPFCSRGDFTRDGNRHFRLAPDGLSCLFRMYGRQVRLDLAAMTGNAGEILRQAARLAAAKKINVTFRIDATKLHVTVDPQDLPDHPERRRPLVALKGRAIGIDLNPGSIGITAVENATDPTSVEQTQVLEHFLVKLGMPIDASAETVRETLAAVCDRAISLARKHRCGTITMEKGLGKLRSSNRGKKQNRELNYWARTILVAMLTRKARLAGIDVIEVWSGYSTTIGNVAFELPDACAAAAEIARRGISRLAGIKDVLPTLGEGWRASLRKDLPLPAEAGSWVDIHRTIKAAKIGYRRPHPEVPQRIRVSDAHGTLTSCGHAVVRLRRRHRPALLFRLASPKQDGAGRIPTFQSV